MHLWAELGGPRLSWGRLGRLIRQLPEDAATWRSLYGEKAIWTVEHHLAATIADHLAIANWQRGGGKKKDRPKPIPRPGIDPGTKKIGDASRFTPVQARALLDALKPASH